MRIRLTAKTSPGGCSLTSIEFEDPRANELTRITQALGLSVAVHEAKTPSMNVTLNCVGKSVQISKSSK